MAVKDDEHQSITTIVPINKSKSAFFFATKKPLLRYQGHFTYEKSKDDVVEWKESKYNRNVLGFHDHGRGVWPYISGWIWGSFTTVLKKNGNRLGLNIGYGFSDPDETRCT